jgi:hypothetical protein
MLRMQQWAGKLSWNSHVTRGTKESTEYITVPGSDILKAQRLNGAKVSMGSVLSKA